MELGKRKCTKGGCPRQHYTPWKHCSGMPLHSNSDRSATMHTKRLAATELRDKGIVFTAPDSLGDALDVTVVLGAASSLAWETQGDLLGDMVAVGVAPSLEYKTLGDVLGETVAVGVLSSME
eukprot:gb/GECG01003151.1/.p1 GENE.gb/GECG01003151.1/~~gb/GECG01003151.1/.p1  ORF type:complete len:122 (+),score=13.09 gb/GECG01003151.1/:1-366(+)